MSASGGHEPLYVSVIGGSDADQPTMAAAQEVGRLLAEHGAVVVTGGRSGVAEAASKGAVLAGGVAVGILPGPDRAEANPWVSVAVCTGMGETRNALVVMNGDAVIALDGGFGTLSEIGHALVAGRTVVGLGAWELRRGGTAEGSIVRAASPAAAVEAALGAAFRRRRGG
ncbi:TIGR00725 family protein [Rhabdothermincola sediminis]|uniref:TIGR00725 family protein n=1 Tax=Rhabdothermincola sediminis TaxID=2751370 RepID=UPI001AA09425|nr:TIGR00725 family protein [Rhabdothermincola sediminis]